LKWSICWEKVWNDLFVGRKFEMIYLLGESLKWSVCWEKVWNDLFVGRKFEVICLLGESLKWSMLGENLKWSICWEKVWNDLFVWGKFEIIFDCSQLCRTYFMRDITKPGVIKDQILIRLIIKPIFFTAEGLTL
jgi:hypothetical protein